MALSQFLPSPTKVRNLDTNVTSPFYTCVFVNLYTTQQKRVPFKSSMNNFKARKFSKPKLVTHVTLLLVVKIEEIIGEPISEIKC